MFNTLDLEFSVLRRQTGLWEVPSCPACEFLWGNWLVTVRRQNAVWDELLA